MKSSIKSYPIALVLLVPVLALLAGCNSGESLADAMKKVTDDQLAIMVLPQDELGPDAADLPVDPSAGAGFIDAEQVAEGTPDADDTAADLEAAGYVNGYELSYADYSGTHPVLEFDTAVQLFDTEDNATGWLARFLSDFQATEGQDQYGHEDIKVSDEDGLGDEAKLLTATFTLDDQGTKGHTSAVMFRLGRIVAYASENRADDGDTTGPSRQAARRLEERVEGVLKGDIKEEPVHIPSEEEAAAIQIQGVLDQVSEAFNGKDIDAYIAFWTDNGLQQAFNVSRQEALDFLNESIGEPPIDFKNVSGVEFTENGASFEVDFVDGPLVKHARITVIDEGGGPQIDGVEYLTTPVPSGVKPIDLQLDEFAFNLDADSIGDGNIAFEVTNAGQQPHEIVIEKVPEGIDLLDTYRQAVETEAEPEGTESVGYVAPLEPGATTTVVFAEPLAPGRYALLCFVPDSSDPAGTPHLLKGMVGEFTVP